MINGGAYEEIIDTSTGAVTQKSYVDGFMVQTKIGSTTEITYLHKDHLGSTEAMTDVKGNLLNRMSFDVWGNRQKADWQSGIPAAGELNVFKTTKGYTGHEQLDQHNLVHMGGRVYDPTLGRFLSADLFIQSPYNTQSFNRYSYVFNNPLSYTDPTGYRTDDTYANQPNGLTNQERAQLETMAFFNGSMMLSWFVRDAGYSKKYVGNQSFNVDTGEGQMKASIAEGLLGEIETGLGEALETLNDAAKKAERLENKNGGGLSLTAKIGWGWSSFLESYKSSPSPWTARNFDSSDYASRSTGLPRHMVKATLPGSDDVTIEGLYNKGIPFSLGTGLPTGVGVIEILGRRGGLPINPRLLAANTTVGELLIITHAGAIFASATTIWGLQMRNMVEPQTPPLNSGQ